MVFILRLLRNYQLLTTAAFQQMVFPESLPFLGKRDHAASFFVLQLRSGHFSWLLVIFLHSHTPTHVLGPCFHPKSTWILTHLALSLIPTSLAYLMTEKNRPLQNNTGRIISIFLRNFIESKTKIKNGEATFLRSNHRKSVCPSSLYSFNDRLFTLKSLLDTARFWAHKK